MRPEREGDRMTHKVVMRQRFVSIPESDDAVMVRMAGEYGCSVAELYRRATALYILTQSRAESFDYWPGDPGTEETTWSGEGV